MTTITIDRAVVEQALELLGTWAKPPARLYRVMDNLRAALAQQDEPLQEPVATLIAQRDALLEALKEMLEYSGLIEERCDTATTNKARAAIEAVEGEKT